MPVARGGLSHIVGIFCFGNILVLKNFTIYKQTVVGHGEFNTLYSFATGCNIPKIIFFNSVSGGTGASSMAAATALRFAAKNKKTLYLNIEKFGSDPVRWYMIENSQPWDNLKYDEEGVAEVSRKLFSTLFNTYKFFALYANVDGFTGKENNVEYTKRPEIDRWIISLLNTLISDVQNALDDYEPTKAARAISEFVNDNLSNWYVRLNRKRFWAGEMNEDKLSAYQTLHTCLKIIAQLMAPIAPFYADKLYSDLMAPISDNDYTTVHLSLFPEVNNQQINKELEQQMKLAQDITSNVLALRRKVNLKVRQPLQTLLIPVIDTAQRNNIIAMQQLIASEVNVKEIKIVENEESGLIKRVKADFKKLGPRYGKIMKLLGKAIQEMDQKQIAELEKNSQYCFDELPETPIITTDDVEIIPEDIPGWLVANEGNLTVALDVTVTPNLRNEGLARELVNRIQNIRKSSDFEITDKVKIEITHNPETDSAINEFGQYIATQVLAIDIKIVEKIESDNVQELDIDGIIINILVEKN